MHEVPVDLQPLKSYEAVAVCLALPLLKPLEWLDQTETQLCMCLRVERSDDVMSSLRLKTRVCERETQRMSIKEIKVRLCPLIVAAT